MRAKEILAERGHLQADSISGTPTRCAADRRLPSSQSKAHEGARNRLTHDLDLQRFERQQ
jgi:hypothetical protein